MVAPPAGAGLLHGSEISPTLGNGAPFAWPWPGQVGRGGGGCRALVATAFVPVRSAMTSLLMSWIDFTCTGRGVVGTPHRFWPSSLTKHSEPLQGQQPNCYGDRLLVFACNLN